MYVLTCQSKVQRFALPILIGLAAVGALPLFIVPPIAQPRRYHDFADQRLLLGIPNFGTSSAICLFSSSTGGEFLCHGG